MHEEEVVIDDDSDLGSDLDDDDIPDSDDDCLHPPSDSDDDDIPDSDDDCLHPPSDSDNDCLATDFETEVSVSSDDSDVDFEKINRMPDDDSDVESPVEPLESNIRDEVAEPLRLTLPVCDRTTPDIGWEPDEMAAFLMFNPPHVLLCILAAMHSLGCYAVDRYLDSVEFFSGQAQVTRAWAEAGLKSLDYDILNDSKYQNLNSHWGFIHALQCMRRLRPRRGVCWLGTVCSTWVFMSRNSTMRTHLNPQGDISRTCVRNGNRQASRSALLIAICYSRLLGYVLEQPGSSMIWRHPSMAHAQATAVKLGARWHRVSLYMWHYASEHMKRTELLSNESWTHNLSNDHPGSKGLKAKGPRTADTYTRADGRKMCTGTKHLKSTQTYTKEFGQAVSLSFLEQRTFFDDVNCTRGQLDLGDINISEDDPWQDSELNGVADAFLHYHSLTNKPS